MNLFFTDRDLIEYFNSLHDMAYRTNTFTPLIAHDSE
jgi:hypothetical protein